jgi:hypothetical protein
MRGVLIVIEILEFTLLYSVEQDRDFIGMELADHFSLFPSILTLHSLKLFNMNLSSNEINIIHHRLKAAQLIILTIDRSDHYLSLRRTVKLLFGNIVYSLEHEKLEFKPPAQSLDRSEGFEGSLVHSSTLPPLQGQLFAWNCLISIPLHRHSQPSSLNNTKRLLSKRLLPNLSR